MKTFTDEKHPIQMFWLLEVRRNLNLIESDKIKWWNKKVNDYKLTCVKFSLIEHKVMIWLY